MENKALKKYDWEEYTAKNSVENFRQNWTPGSNPGARFSKAPRLFRADFGHDNSHSIL